MPKKKQKEKRINILRRILKQHQYEEIDNIIVDAVTANMLVIVYNSLTKEESREKFEKLNLKVLVKWGWKQVK